MTESNQKQDTKRALLEAKQQAVEASRSGDQEVGKKPSRWRLTLAFVVTLGFGVYLVVASPAWFVTPPPPPESSAVSEASLRIAMWQQAVRVQQFQQAQGRLPGTLDEAGAPFIEGINYQPLDDDEWVIQGINGLHDLTLRSEQSFDTFLGNSVAVVARRGES